MFQFGKLIRVGLCAAAGLAASIGTPASAATNLGFETSDVSGWTTNGGPALAVTAYGSFSPAAGHYLGAVEAGLGQNVFTTLSQSFELFAGGTISGFAGFQANDYYPFNDAGYLAVNGVNLLTWDVLTVGDFGNSGWTGFSFTALTTGTYTLELGVANGGDNGFPSGAVIDRVSVTGQVPEAASWAMMVVGFGLAGASLRNRRSAISFG